MLTKEHAFCFNSSNNKSLRVNKNSTSNSSKLIATTTRQNPMRNTFDIQIKSIKIALGSKKLNDAIHKIKYQMQNIHHMIEAVANYISERSKEEGTFSFSKVASKYACSQIPLALRLEKHCTFNILGGKATGTFRFLNVFSWFNRHSHNLQKNNGCYTEKLQSQICVPGRHISDNQRHIEQPRKRTSQSASFNRQKKCSYRTTKCEFAKTEIIWLSFKI